MKITTIDVIQLAFAALVFYGLVRDIRSGEAFKRYRVFKRLSFWQWTLTLLSTFVAVAVVITSLVLILTYGPTILQWSWLKLFDQKSAGGNLSVTALKIPYFGIIFGAMLLVNIPNLAFWEEMQFRKGTRTWLQAIPKSLYFGMAHCLIGVPLGAGLALSIGGMWFTYNYFKGGIKRSTRAHAIYNFTILAVVGSYLLFASR